MGIKEIGSLAAFIVIAVLVAVSVSSFMGGESDSNEITGAVVGAGGGEVQEVALSFENYAYVVDPPTVEAGSPVKMVADLDSLYGCMTAVRIPKLGVSKNVRSGDNIIEFTPSSPGTYTITCSMGMGVGEIVVV
jgi:plastocyanin